MEHASRILSKLFTHIKFNVPVISEKHNKSHLQVTQDGLDYHICWKFLLWFDYHMNNSLCDFDNALFSR